MVSLRILLISCICSLPFAPLGAQVADSLVLRQVDSLNALCESLIIAEKLEEALQINEVALQQATLHQGNASMVYGKSYLHRAYIYCYSKSPNLKEAEKWALESHRAYTKASPKAVLEYGRCCFFLGCVYFQLNQRQQAEAFLLESLSAFEKSVGREHADYATSVIALKVLYDVPYVTAEHQALSVIIDNRNSPSLNAQLLQNLGDFYIDISRFNDAEWALLNAKKLRMELNKESLEYAETLLMLSDLYRKWKKDEQAEPFIKEAMSVVEEKMGRNHPAYASVLNKAAFFYQNRNNEKAEQYWREVSQILESSKTTSCDYLFAAIDNLADIYKLRNDFGQAQKLYLNCRKILDNLLGLSSTDYSRMAMANMGVLYTQDHATLLFQEAQKILLEISTSDPSKSPSTLAFLSEIFLMGSNYEQAKSNYQEVRAIEKKGLKESNNPDLVQPPVEASASGRQRSDHGSSLYTLAALYSQIGQRENVSAYWQNYNRLARHLIEQTAVYASNQEAPSGPFAEPFPTRRFLALSRHIPETPISSLAGDCYNDALFFKGQIIEKTRHLANKKNNTESLRQTYDRWQSVRRQLAQQYELPLPEQKEVSVLGAEAKTYEAALGGHQPTFYQKTDLSLWEAVQQKLHPGEAAVEFVVYPKDQSKDNNYYVALLLLPGTEAPLFLPLFQENQLAPLLQNKKADKAEFYNSLYAASQQGGLLYDLIWKPLSAFLPTGVKVYFSPAGLLHRLNLAALPAPEGKLAAEKWRLVQMNSTYDLTASEPGISRAVAVLYGGIQYDDAARDTTDAKTTFKPTNTFRGLDFSQTDSTLRGGAWGYLLWTDVEVSAAAQILQQNGFKAVLKKGVAATEASLKALGADTLSPSILHIATHGYFFSDPVLPDAADTNTFNRSEHPMIRSGLILAGGNHAWKTGRSLHEGQEDGILTAYEISQLNLSNTELVVLSACETGLGEIQSREGVYGLQRAFKLAGTRHLIMSLWQVRDFQTQVFMKTFYRQWLERKKTINEAFYSAQAELRQKYGNAFWWAGFVLME